jgi:signal transduction histidine kinase
MSEEKGMPVGTTASAPRLTILVVDDEAYVFDLLVDTFEADYDVMRASEGLSALELAIARLPDLILLDVMLPGLDGYEICGSLKNTQQTMHIPIIFLTGAADSDAETKGLQMGATDFVSKPINSAALRARVTNQMNLKQAQDQLLRSTAQKYLDDLAAQMERSSAKDRARLLELQMKDEFLTHVSHELRAPLTAIYLFVSLMADRLAGNTTQQQDDYLVRTLDNVEQMKSMVDDLLDTASIRNGQVRLELQPVVIAEAFKYALNTLKKRAADKFISITEKASEPLETVYTDRQRLKQILIILLENAVKFTPCQGAITVGWKAFAEDAGFVLIEVADTGCGIVPEACEVIFDRLYQTDSSDHGRMGLGLGLHIAKELVTMQDGSIWVESVVGKGSIFCFTLPVFSGQSEPLSQLDQLDF